MKETRSIWTKLRDYPPVLVRLLARNPDGTAMSDTDIVVASDRRLSRADVKHLSYSTSWSVHPVRVMEAFVTACGVDFASREQMRNANRYCGRSPKFTHLRRHPDWKEFRQMLAEYYKSQVPHA